MVPIPFFHSQYEPDSSLTHQATIGRITRFTADPVSNFQTIIPNSRKVLLFGTTGEIGSRVGRFCVDAGHQVTGVSRGKKILYRVDLNGVEMISGDKGDESFLRTLATERQFDVVIDMVPTTEHLERAYKYFQNEVGHLEFLSSI